MKPKAKSYGNRSELITVQLPNGKTVQAIAANCVNTSNVTVIKEGDRYFAWGSTPPKVVLSKRFPYLKREESEEEVETLLPFQVLFVTPVQLGGDRAQTTLSGFDPVEIGGVNNLGNQEYLAVWLQDKIIVDNNGAQTALDVPDQFELTPPSWIGSGLLSVEVIPLFPEVNLIKTITDDELPQLVEPPLYPAIAPYPYAGDIDGTTTYTQTDQGYNYNEIETYYFDYVISGTAGITTPTPAQPNAFCTPFNDGDIDILTFRRDTEFSYLKTVTETLSGKTGVFFNNLFYGSDQAEPASQAGREETYSETFSYIQTPAQFRTISYFQCAGQLYSWVPTHDRDVSWEGQTETTDFDYTRIINEPEWDKPISPNVTRKQRHLRTEIGTRDSVYEVPANDWTVSAFDFSNNFDIEGTDTENITTTIAEDRLTPTTKLISGDGTSVLFTEEAFTLESTFVSDLVRKIDRYHSSNITIETEVTSHLETTNVTRSDISTFSLASGSNLFSISTTDSWLFSVVTDTSLDTGVVTLSNDDDSPIFESELNAIASYERIEDKVANNVTFNNVIDEPIAFWDKLESSLISVVSQGFRAQAVLLSYNFQDSPLPELPIQIIRSISSLSLQVLSIEPYPQGLANPGEILAYPVENCSVLLRDRILNDENRVHCNLVGNLLYFSKSVIEDLSLSEQVTEVYAIGETVTQEALETGAFIPINAAGTVLGTSYFPVD